MCRSTVLVRFVLLLLLPMIELFATTPSCLAATTTSLRLDATSASWYSVHSPLHNERRLLLLDNDNRRPPFLSSSLLSSSIFTIRGGSTRVLASDDDDDDDDDGKDEQHAQEVEKLRSTTLAKYRLDQQHLMELRSTFLSEALARRGIPFATIVDVSSADNDKVPQIVDWDCATSTWNEPKTCLYSFDAEPNTKVVAPIDTTQWITLSALNRLRRTDPTKVEPMWHNQYAILQSWFGDDSDYSMLQHVDLRGLLINVLLDTGRGGIVLKTVLAMGMVCASLIALPMLDFVLNRFLTSGLVWLRWPTWARIVHAALPLKLLLGQLTCKYVAHIFGKLEKLVRDAIVDMECTILEDSVPLTVGPGSQVVPERSTYDDDDDEEEDVFFEAREFPDDDDSDESDW